MVLRSLDVSLAGMWKNFELWVREALKVGDRAEEAILAEDKTDALNVASGSPAHRVSEGGGGSIRN